MCICRQPPIHIYDPGGSFLANVSWDLAVRVREWSYAMSGHRPMVRMRVIDCPCSDDYVASSAFGILSNSGHLLITLAFVILLLVAPVMLGLVKRIERKHLRRVLLTWLTMVLWSFGVAFTQGAGLEPSWAAAAPVHLPLQLAFDIAFLLLLPALPIFLADRCVAVIQRRFAAPV